MRAELAVHPQQEEREADRGHDQQIGDRGGQRAPGQDRHPVDRHARRAGAQEGDDEIGRADRGRDAEEDHAQRIEIHVHAGIVPARGVGHVVEPAVVRPGADREARIHENAGGEIDPVGERVQPRECHVARAEQQRPQIVAETGQDRQCVQEDHRHPVRREQLVVLLRREQLLIGPRQLDAHDQRLDAAQHQEGERGDDVAEADLLVVDGRQPAGNAGFRLPNLIQFVRSKLQ